MRRTIYSIFNAFMLKNKLLAQTKPAKSWLVFAMLTQKDCRTFQTYGSLLRPIFLYMGISPSGFFLCPEVFDHVDEV